MTTTPLTDSWTESIEVGPGVSVQVQVSGAGTPILLVHGWPHTGRVWDPLVPRLMQTRQVVVPDLRGTGGSTRAKSGYDAATLAADLIAVLDATTESPADLVAIDAGASPAFLLALQHPERVRRMVLMEATLGVLPGAEEFFAGGAPWWFGFHQVPGLAESVVAGHEGDYLDFFFRIGTHGGRGVDPVAREAFVEAYTGRESLRCGFEIYRAMRDSARQLSSATAEARLQVPTMAIGAATVGDALYRQLVPVADDLRGERIGDCGHIVPQDRPEALGDLLEDFLA